MDEVTREQLDHARNGAPPEGALLFETAFWTAKQAQVHLGVSDPTFNLWAARGHVPVTRFHGSRYLTSDQMRIAARYARASHERRGIPWEPGELGEPSRFEVER